MSFHSFQEVHDRRDNETVQVVAEVAEVAEVASGGGSGGEEVHAEAEKETQPDGSAPKKVSICNLPNMLSALFFLVASVYS